MELEPAGPRRWSLHLCGRQECVVALRDANGPSVCRPRSRTDNSPKGVGSRSNTSILTSRPSAFIPINQLLPCIRVATTDAVNHQFFCIIRIQRDFVAHALSLAFSRRAKTPTKPERMVIAATPVPPSTPTCFVLLARTLCRSHSRTFFNWSAEM